MEIDVTRLIDGRHEMREFSSSRHESDLDNIGQITWRNAVDYAYNHLLVRGKDLAVLEDWIVEWGAWTREETKAMTEREMNALLVQFIASDYREHWEGLEDGESPESPGLLYRGDDGRWYYYIGH